MRVGSARVAYALFADWVDEKNVRCNCPSSRPCRACQHRWLGVDDFSLDIDNAMAAAHPYRGPTRTQRGEPLA